MSIPPREVFAKAARDQLAQHDAWDSPHAFITLHWDGTSLNGRTYACIMPDIDPPDYPACMSKIAREQFEKDPADPAYAYLLQIEGFGIPEPGKDATGAERDQYNRDRLGRTFHQRADAVECALAWVADIHGRVWSAEKIRGREDEGIREQYHAPGQTPGGHMIRGLLAVAYATGVMGHSLPGPQGTFN